MGGAGRSDGDSDAPARIPLSTIRTSWRLKKEETSLDPTVFAAVGGHWTEKLDTFMARHAISPPFGENQPGWWLTAVAEGY